MEQCEAETLTINEQVRVNGALTAATLSDYGRIRWTESNDLCLTVEKEVIGFAVEGSRIRIRAFVESEIGLSCVGSRGIRVRKDFVFEPLSEDSQQLWCQKLQEFIDSLERPKRLFIIVNPFGGRKSGSKIFHEEVKPLLEAADIQFTEQETQYQLHAKEIAQTLDLSMYDGIVCLSGDGILVEVVNGLLQREDWDAAIKMPLGIIPAAYSANWRQSKSYLGPIDPENDMDSIKDQIRPFKSKWASVSICGYALGTGNGMVKSLLDSVDDHCSVLNATLAIIRGYKHSLDVATVLQGETRFFSVLMLAWGLVADIDIESEKYRWMGSSRLDFYALLRIIRLRKYNGRVSFVPAPGYEAYGEPGEQKVGCTSKLDICSQSQEETVKVQKHGYQGPEVFLENLEWRNINGPFVSVWLHNVPWGTEDTKAAPDAKFSDGYLDLIIMKDCPKSSLLTLMAKLNDGSHVKSPYVLYLKVKAFILEPGQRLEDPTKGGIIDSDGEVLARGEGTYKCEQKDLMTYGTIQMTVDKGLATLFSPR
ncbi:hypothetical protein HHK36_023711 [Tetracentron sinense]|uniref:DAGKc domain-containing protein n=1 Tax=Tetracentron sinense TaxID=13715 RepID=A0A834YN54_TETSI|nr:hypothetical protein HHK36_023711 [Tetracentron sinense]